MSKIISLFVFLLTILCFIPLFNSEEEIPKNNTQEEEDNINIVEDNLNMTDDIIVGGSIDSIINPFLKYNFTNIIHLDDSNYTTEITKNESIFVFFYAPWCHGCDEVIPAYIELSDYCKEKNMSVVFYKVDGNMSHAASEMFEVSNFPTIYFVHQGEKYEFYGDKSKRGMLYFMERKIHHDIFEIKKLNEVKNIVNMFNTSLYLISTVKDNTSAIYKSFVKFAKDAIYIDFISCLSAECLDKYGENIILLKNFDEKENIYTRDYGKLEDAKNDSVKDFTSIFAIETGVFATQHDINLGFEFKKFTLYYIRNSSNEELTKYDYMFKELGKELRNNNTYAYVCAPDGNRIQGVIAKAFSIIPDELPGVFYYDPYTDDPMAKIKLYSLRGLEMSQISKDYIKDFILDIKAG